MKRLPTLAPLSVVISAGAAAAGTVSYTGNWLVTVSHGTYFNGTACLVLKDDGSLGWPHSGSATLPDDNLNYGTFKIIDGLLVATIEAPGDTGQNAGIVFTGRANNGSIGKGVYEEVYGGEDFDSGKAVFAANGC